MEHKFNSPRHAIEFFTLKGLVINADFHRKQASLKYTTDFLSKLTKAYDAYNYLASQRWLVMIK